MMHLYTDNVEDRLLEYQGQHVGTCASSCDVGSRYG